MQWANNWSTSNLTQQCKNCIINNVFPGVSSYTCDCPINGNLTTVTRSSCFSSCCPSGQVSLNSSTGQLQCNAPGSPTPTSCSVQVNNQSHACPFGWTGDFQSLCINCYEIRVYGVTQVICSCDDGVQYKTVSCFSTCCPSRLIDAANLGFNCGRPGDYGCGPDITQPCLPPQ